MEGNHRAPEMAYLKSTHLGAYLKMGLSASGFVIRFSYTKVMRWRGWYKTSFGGFYDANRWEGACK